MAAKTLLETLLVEHPQCFVKRVSHIDWRGVVVNPGDMIIADENGISTVPNNQLEEILKLAQEQAEREEGTRKQIARGKTVDELLEEFGRI